MKYRIRITTWPAALGLMMLNYAGVTNISWFWIIGLLFLSEILTVTVLTLLTVAAILSVGQAKEERRKVT